MRRNPFTRPISVGPFGNRVIYDPVAKTITRRYTFRKITYSSVGAYVNMEAFQNGRNMNPVLGPANLLRTGKVTVSLTITFPDCLVVQWSTTERGTIIEGYRMAAQKLAAMVNAANVQSSTTFRELDRCTINEVGTRAPVYAQSNSDENSRVDIHYGPR